jgi:hypothetical protein
VSGRLDNAEFVRRVEDLVDRNRGCETRDRGPTVIKVAAHLLAHPEHLGPGFSNVVFRAVGGRRADVLWALGAIRVALESERDGSSHLTLVPWPGYQHSVAPPDSGGAK